LEFFEQRIETRSIEPGAGVFMHKVAQERGRSFWHAQSWIFDEGFQDDTTALG